MVHALKIAHSLLKPAGRLINVQNLPVPHAIEVHTAGKVIKAGWVLDNTDFEADRFAFNALAEVVSQGIFNLEDERDFSFNVHAADLHELQEWLADWWETAVLPDKTIQRIEDNLRQAGPAAKGVIKLQTRMTKLRCA